MASSCAPTKEDIIARYEHMLAEALRALEESLCHDCESYVSKMTYQWWVEYLRNAAERKAELRDEVLKRLTEEERDALGF